MVLSISHPFPCLGLKTTLRETLHGQTSSLIHTEKDPRVRKNIVVEDMGPRYPDVVS